MPSDPVPYQPPLTPWRHTWRLFGALVISSLASGDRASLTWEHHRPLFWAEIALGVAGFVLVLRRRRWPFGVALMAVALTVVSELATGPAVLASVSLATRREFVRIGVLGAVSVAAGALADRVHGIVSLESPWLVVSTSVLPIAATLAWGMFIGSRRELVWTLRQRAERAESEQESRAQQARSTERQRIAREMHDVLAHRISQVAMHAGALAFREDLSAAELREGTGQIQQRANEALQDLRSVLGVLRDPESGSLLDRPQPTYADLPELLAAVQAGGQRVEYADELGPGAVPSAGLGRTLYRVIQEGLTNAAKHAPGSRVDVRLAGSPEQGVTVEVRNPLGFGVSAVPGSGLGLIGLAERAELRGGRLDHRVEDGTFVLSVWLPWTP